MAVSMAGPEACSSVVLRPGSPSTLASCGLALDLGVVFVHAGLRFRHDGQGDRVHAIDDRPLGIKRADDADHGAGGFGGARRLGVGDFVADRIQNYARMIAIFAHHRSQVVGVMVTERRRIIVAGFMHPPHVECLVHNQQTKLIAGIEEGLGQRIMGRANGVETLLFHDARAAIFGLRQGRRTENAVVVVHAAAVEQDALAVDSQALACIEGQRADTKTLGMGVEQGAVCVVQFDACGVECRRIWGPELGVGDGAGVVSSIVIRYS